MNSRRRSQDPKEKKEGKNEQTGISYFDWRNAKRKSKGKEKIRVTRKDSFCLFRLPCTMWKWKCSPWLPGCHGGSTPRGRTCTLSGRCTLCPLTRLKKIKLVKKKLLQWINVQQSPTSESCTLQNRTFSQLKNISLWETLSLWFVCLLIFPWEKTADKQKFYKKNLLYHLALFSLTQGRFSEDSRTSTRFVFQTQKPLFYIFMLFHEQRQVLEIQILNLYLKVFFRLLCLGDLGPLYPGTKAPELQQIMVAYVPCCTAQQSLCTHRRTETQKYIPGPFWSSLSFRTIYVPLWRLYDISAFFIDSQE